MTKATLGSLLWIACLQYFAAEALAISGFQGGYSLSLNVISDLGALRCDPQFCSPLRNLMNTSFLLQGALIAAGSLLLWARFPASWPWRIAQTLIAASAVGVFLVGIAPEDANPPLHYFGAAENFLTCNAGAALMGYLFLKQGPRYRRIGLFSLILGTAALVAAFLLSQRLYFGLGVGIIERITAYPFPIWIATMGFWLRRNVLVPNT